MAHVASIANVFGKRTAIISAAKYVLQRSTPDVCSFCRENGAVIRSCFSGIFMSYPPIRICSI